MTKYNYHNCFDLFILINSGLMLIFNIPYSSNDVFWLVIYWAQVFFCCLFSIALLGLYIIPEAEFKLMSEKFNEQDYDLKLTDIVLNFMVLSLLIFWGAFNIVPLYILGKGILITFSYTVKKLLNKL